MRHVKPQSDNTEDGREHVSLPSETHYMIKTMAMEMERLSSDNNAPPMQNREISFELVTGHSGHQSNAR
jgi:hypothetical protein